MLLVRDQLNCQVKITFPGPEMDYSALHFTSEAKYQILPPLGAIHKRAELS